MAGISSLGVGSGLDLNGILQKIMSVEEQPLIRLASRESAVKTKISALGSLKSAIDNLGTSAATLIPGTGKLALDFFTSFKATVSDTTVAQVSTTGSPVKASYSLDVIRLAQAHRIASTGALSASGPVLDGGATSGSLTIELGSVSGGVFSAKTGTTPVTIAIDGTNNTLSGLRDAINKANAGVTATILTGDSGPKLVLTSKDTGTSSQIRLTNVSGLSAFQFDPATNTGNFTADPAQGGQAAQDAQIKVNGIVATGQSNTFTNVIEGLSITALKETAASTALAVERESTLATTLGAFVKAYNEAAKTMRDLGQYNKTGASGPLLGHAALRGVQSRLSSLISSRPTGIAEGAAFETLSAIGVRVEKDGSLKLDTAKLTKAIETNASAVADLVAAFGNTIKTATAPTTGLPGLVNAATEGMNATLRDFGRQREVLTDRLDAIETRYRRQFSAMDTLVASMNKTGAYLQQQLANLPQIGS